MTCPDLDRLIDLYHGFRDPELETHVKSCPSCQADLEAILLVPIALGSEVELPEGLVERVLAALPLQDSRPELHRESLGQMVVTSVLGSATGAFALVALGAGGGGPALLLIFSLIAGVLYSISAAFPGIWAGLEGRIPATNKRLTRKP